MHVFYVTFGSPHRWDESMGGFYGFAYYFLTQTDVLEICSNTTDQRTHPECWASLLRSFGRVVFPKYFQTQPSWLGIKQFARNAG